MPATLPRARATHQDVLGRTVTSTVALEEMREGIGKVISMAKMKEAMADTSHGGVQGGVHDAEKKKAS